jgi:transposase
MRGEADRQPVLFHVFQVEDRIPGDHPLRDIKRRADRILDTLHDKFEAAYSSTGRPSVPPERLLKALLLMGLYSVRSERQLCEQIDLNLLFRWFLDLQPSEDAFDASTLTKNRARLETYGLTKAFFDAVVAEALAKDLCSEHFSVDGTLIESFASAKSFQPKDAAAEPGKESKSDDEGPRPDGNGFKPSNPDVDFHGQKRTNETHRSQTDPEAKLYRKGRGKEAKLSHMGHVLAENRNGLILTVVATEANGTAERTAALDMLDDLRATHQRVPATLGGDKGYDDGDFFVKLEGRKIEPHVPLVREPADPKAVKSKKRLPGIRARRRMKKRMGTEAYRLSQRCRKKLEECFGWLKVIAGMDRSRLVGRWKLRQLLEISGAAFNLVRLRRLAPVAG